jgi:hypothetical protein
MIEMIEPRNDVRSVIPYDTGKVKIGILYTPPLPKMDAYDEQIQEVLLGVRPWRYTVTRYALAYCATALVSLFFVLFWTWARGGNGHA